MALKNPANIIGEEEEEDPVAIEEVLPKQLNY